MNFEIQHLHLEGVLLIKSRIFHDERGHFQELLKVSFFEDLGDFFRPNELLFLATERHTWFTFSAKTS